MKDNRKTIQLLIILTMIFAIIGGTLAYWQWNTTAEQETNVVFTVTQDFSCSADGGGDITHNDVKLAPTSCTDTSRTIKRKVTVTPTLDKDGMTVSLDLWLNINELGEGLKKSNNFRYVLTTSSVSCEEGTILAEGNFRGRKTGDKVRIITNDLYTVTDTDEYWLYIWLDKEETNSNTMNQRFSLSLGGVCDEVATLKGDAYAIYTEGNQTLTFLRSETPITTEDTYNGESITKVYTGFETEYYTEKTIPWTNEREKISNVVFVDEIRPVSTSNWFNMFDIADAIDITKLNTLLVTDMSKMFEYSAGDIIGLENLDTSNVRNMSYMFDYDWSGDIIDLNVSNWDVSNVVDMSGAFSYVYGEIVGLENWDVSNVADMSSMFYGGKTEILGIENWNVSNVTDMSYMFMADYTGPHFDMDLSNWDVSNVSDMSYMFHYTRFGVDIDLSNWEVNDNANYSGFTLDIGGTGKLILPDFNK